MIIKSLGQILEGRPLLSVAPEDMLNKAAAVMSAAKVGAVAVLEDGKLVGILSERDIVYRAVAEGLVVRETPVKAVMTPDPVTVSVDDAVSDALAAKLGDAFRHLPVLDGDRVAGIVSYRDIPPEYLMMFEHFREMSSAKADGI